MHRSLDAERSYSILLEEVRGFIGWIVLGLIAGAIAKAIKPGEQGGGWIATLLLGVVGAIVGGWIGYRCLRCRSQRILELVDVAAGHRRCVACPHYLGSDHAQEGLARTTARGLAFRGQDPWPLPGHWRVPGPQHGMDSTLRVA